MHLIFNQSPVFEHCALASAAVPLWKKKEAESARVSGRYCLAHLHCLVQCQCTSMKNVNCRWPCGLLVLRIMDNKGAGWPQRSVEHQNCEPWLTLVTHVELQKTIERTHNRATPGCYRSLHFHDSGVSHDKVVKGMEPMLSLIHI